MDISIPQRGRDAERTKQVSELHERHVWVKRESNGLGSQESRNGAS